LKGQRMVIRCFLDLKRILDHHEVYYVYGKIWVDDICTWLQTCARFATLCNFAVE
jgi:protein SHQ1